MCSALRNCYANASYYPQNNIVLVHGTLDMNIRKRKGRSLPQEAYKQSLGSGRDNTGKEDSGKDYNLSPA